MRQSILFSVVLTVCVIGGCSGSGGPTASVEGEVTVDGSGIEEGLVSFTPLESGKGLASTAEIREGHYRADAVPLGRVLVRFQAMKATGNTFTEFGKEYPETVSIIPPQYDTGMEIDVAADQESHDFALTTKH